MAADLLDVAADLQAVDAANALEIQLAKLRFDRPSRVACRDCDDPIPPQRRLLGGMERCAECQGYFEQAMRQRGER